jgi:hypothetical protein
MGSFLLEGAIQRVGNIDGSPHICIVPYLWQYINRVLMPQMKAMEPEDRALVLDLRGIGRGLLIAAAWLGGARYGSSRSC